MSARAFGLLILLLLASPAAHPAGAGTKEKELRELRGRIEALQKRLAESEESKSEAADALRESERAISETNRELRELGAQSREINQRLAELGAESRRQEEALKAQQERLAQLLYQHYLGGESEPLKLLLNREDPNDIARRLHYFGYISRARARLIVETRESLARLQELARETGQKASELAVVTAESKALRARLEREKRARGQVLTRISRNIQRQRREIGTLKRDETRLTRLIESLAKLMARSKPTPRLRNERVPQASSGDSPFLELKGKLNLPVRGELANRFGSPRADGGVVWKGLFIAARAGEEVRAVADGRVVFADWLRGFGNLLIVDHGDAYMSLYGNNEALYKQVGDPIRGGEPVAAVGASGGNTDSGLYFELRHQGRPLDPLDWVGTR
ncbi:MAG TPA: peptidoglycan DD-metalloendopeptidase family protein [Burkholderiales bacterium]|nr:peptidoglycan DD-metalloendopeptidase family protein [Burkholderiales bacterium]